MRDFLKVFLVVFMNTTLVTRYLSPLIFIIVKILNFLRQSLSLRRATLLVLGLEGGLSYRQPSKFISQNVHSLLSSPSRLQYAWLFSLCKKPPTAVRLPGAGARHLLVDYFSSSSQRGVTLKKSARSYNWLSLMPS